MERWREYFDFLTFLTQGGKLPLLLLGMTILLLNVCWLLIQLLYGGVSIYNLQVGETYTYLGSRWIERKKGRYILSIPENMIERSSTTRYKLQTGRFFARIHQGRLLCIQFGKEHEACVPIRREMIAKNHVATCPRL
ncbi:MAG: hypothetical protein ACI4D2_08135 [Lachnospiraceae bacterium]